MADQEAEDKAVWGNFGLVLQVIAAVASAVAAGFAAWMTYRAPIEATKLANDLQRRDARYGRKLDCLRRVAGLRRMPPPLEWLEALNETLVTFNDAPQVLADFKKFQTNASNGGHNNSDLIELIKSMMDDLRLDRSKINDDQFLTFLSPNVANSQSGIATISTIKK